ncbi:unnamed protein product [Moneuplotes crassus]|uniref:Rab-GAP TBC domain-containing protein n=1 Tax=Euplotes crassus TaxID=5936 RepID=A0AAD1U391_EUPCR|nr:unnamed protein product [Moneuplotes crassus]
MTRRSSNGKVFEWNYKDNLDLKTVNKNLMIQINGDRFTDSTTFDSNKCSLVSSLNFKCICGIGSNMHHCEAAQRWTEYAYRHHSRSFDFEKDSEIFNDMLTLAESDSAVQESVQQIKNDICRTVTDEEFFCVGGRGYTTMLEVLTAFALYDKPCGYVQGMNFITASLAYHCNSATAFWLFTSLIEDYELRENYLNGLEGFYERAQSISELAKVEIPEIHAFLVTFEMITLEPVMSLFCNMISLEESKHHLEEFFKRGWKYFNCLFINFLECNSAQIFMCEDQCDILSLFKDYYHCRGGRQSTWSQRIALQNKSTADSYSICDVDWEKLCRKS